MDDEQDQLVHLAGLQLTPGNSNGLKLFLGRVQDVRVIRCERNMQCAGTGERTILICNGLLLQSTGIAFSKDLF